MRVEFSDLWDFHTDLRFVQEEPPELPHFREQTDVQTAARMGGLFSATGRRPGLPPEEQRRLVEEQAGLIKGAPGLTLVRSAGQIEGGGRQVLHAEGIYFIQGEEDLKWLDWMWDEGFRSLALTYNEDNALAGGANGDPRQGLTPLGRDVLLEAWRKGFLVCCAHANHRSQGEMAALALESGNPLSYSHGHLDDAFMTKYGERGLPRATVPQIFATGGLIGLCPLAAMYGTYERYLEEIAYLAERAPEQVVLATDFGGARTPLPGGSYLFEEIKGIWAVPAFIGRIAGTHGQSFARAFAGGSLRGFLKRHLARPGKGA